MAQKSSYQPVAGSDAEDTRRVLKSHKTNAPTQHMATTTLRIEGMTCGVSCSWCKALLSLSQ
jgi:hypothetical protein